MSDYYESEIEPMFGRGFLDDNEKHSQPKSSGTRVYYSCKVCGKDGRIEKECCGEVRIKCYDL